MDFAHEFHEDSRMGTKEDQLHELLKKFETNEPYKADIEQLRKWYFLAMQFYSEYDKSTYNKAQNIMSALSRLMDKKRLDIVEKDSKTARNLAIGVTAIIALFEAMSYFKQYPICLF